MMISAAEASKLSVIGCSMTVYMTALRAAEKCCEIVAETALHDGTHTCEISKKTFLDEYDEEDITAVIRILNRVYGYYVKDLGGSLQISW